MIRRSTPRPPVSGRQSRVAIAAWALATAILVATSGAHRTVASTDSADASPQTNAGTWTGTWATALTPASPFDTGRSMSGFANESIRTIVQTSIGGDRLRIRLSNVYGVDDLVIDRATIARPANPSGPDLDPRSIRTLSFNGSSSVIVPAGREVFSDPVGMFVPPLSQLAVTMYLPSATGPTSWHWFGRQTAFIYDGDHTTASSGAGYTGTVEHVYFLAGVDVRGPFRADGAVAVFGASISDGFGATLDANHRWPDVLARRLTFERHRGRDLGVLNLSLSGNATTHDGDEVGFPEIGRNGLDRLDEHIYTRSDVRTVIVDLGLNDIFLHNDPPALIIDGLRRIAASLRGRGIRVLLATLSPADGGANPWTPEREATRQAVNAYIRTTHDADGVVDIDAALADPRNPTKLNPAFDSGDHVHPNDRGNRAIANAVPLGRL